jgi:hypothetical protein|tara:strand:- start:5880 stop:6110 length:231 start_codon:yes stop_codon:yes gene_type:complete
MKLNYHKAPLYLYLQIQETDGLRKVTLFEDFDETFLNYNLNCNLKKLEYFSDFDTKSYSLTKNKEDYTNFYTNYFK